MHLSPKLPIPGREGNLIDLLDDTDETVWIAWEGFIFTLNRKLLELLLYLTKSYLQRLELR